MFRIIQDNVLGPIFSTIYVNGIDKVIKNCITTHVYNEIC